MISNIINIDVSKIIPNKNQPRKVFDDKSLEELSQSIKSYGIIQPITVRKIYDDIYELVAGERRLKAVKLLRMETIPAVVIEVKEEESAAMALIENLQREDLDFIEEAMAFERLIEDFGLNQTQLAEKLGKSQSTIANKMRILKLPESVKNELREAKLTERHARALLKIEDEEILLSVLEKIIKKDLNVSETEKLVNSIAEDLNIKKMKDKRYVRNFINYKIYINTIKNAYNEILKTGIEAKFEQQESDEFIEIKVRIPKKSI
ncbi:nucleoid occlusion protein [Sedimentibacter hydroxybenzoicus DSM 7310]|uniref:Nucleoid occlusion protein n=1 Tax=Sedimentibacter hydroxybenzoicus DSM 7310 TaxID=1123245 RepID=A0A974GXC9_SEDHY|nr:nucleoid occlusion protein [Sedimentibacter hydroxybenzoicus]NYB75457.1 nucleoid occlusion protein [Sedimentibacter hydroxybenzoicus DSM 7310]